MSTSISVKMRSIYRAAGFAAFLPILAACALLGATEARTATLNPYVVTIEQVGPNVVATGSGEFDLAGLNLSPLLGDVAGLTEPVFSAVGLGHGFGDAYLGTVFGLTAFGQGSVTFADSGNGPGVGFVADSSLGVAAGGTLVVPHGYTSGTLLAGSQDIFYGQTLAGLGIIPGTYSWTWGSGNLEADQSFTIQAIAATPIAPTPTAVTPLPAALPLFATGLGALGLLGWRRKRKARAAVA